MDTVVFVTVNGRRSFERVIRVAYNNGVYIIMYRISYESTTFSTVTIPLEEVVKFEIM